MKGTVARAKTGPRLDKGRSAELLYSRLFEVYDRMRRERRIDVFGDLDFEVVQSIDGKQSRIAKLKGNKILVHVNAARLPKSALRYIITHELAHLAVKMHSKKFWEIVKRIHPQYEKGRSELLGRIGSQIFEVKKFESHIRNRPRTWGEIVKIRKYTAEGKNRFRSEPSLLSVVRRNYQAGLRGAELLESVLAEKPTAKKSTIYAMISKIGKGRL